MKKNLLLAAGFVAVLAFSVVPLAAQAGPGCGGCGKGPAAMQDGKGPHGHHGNKRDYRFWKCPKASADLGLTAEQIAKLDGIEDAAVKKLDALRDEIRGLKGQKHAAMKGHPVDGAKVKDLVKKIGELKARKMELKTDLKLQAFGVLTKDQKLKLDQLRDRMHEARMEMKGDCNCGPGCACHQGGECNCGADCPCAKGGEGCGCKGGGACGGAAGK